MPQNCETSYRGMDNPYSLELKGSPPLTVSSDTTMNNNCDNIVNNHLDLLSSTLSINGNRGLYDDTKYSRRGNLNDQGKMNIHNSLHQNPIIETNRSTNHLIPCKKAKFIDDDSTGIIRYPDTTSNSKTIEDKSPEYMVIDSNRKITNHHHHHNPMAPVDVNRDDKLVNGKSPSSVTINPSIYSYMNPLDGNSESIYHSSVNHSLIKPYSSSNHIDSSSSSSPDQENHSPKRSKLETINFQTPVELTMANFPLMVPPHHGPNNYADGYNLKPPSCSQLNRSRSDNALSISSETQSITNNKPQSPTRESLSLLGNSHGQGTIIRSTSSSSPSSSSSSSCSSVDKILPMINVVSLNNETTTTSSTETTSSPSPYNRETIPTISDRDVAIMNISDFVNGYSSSHHYSNNYKINSDSKDSFQSLSSVVSKSSPADLRRVRFQETWDFLNRSDLIEVTLKTADLMKRNQSLQREIDRLKEEVAKIIPSSQLCDDNNQLRVNNVCIENSA